MSYNRVRTPNFYIDAVLLARQLGYIETENSDGLFYLNPTKTKNLAFADGGTQMFKSIVFKNRYFINSLTHVFYLGHDLSSNGISFRIKHEGSGTQNFFTGQTTSSNGWNKVDFSAINEADDTQLTANFNKDTEESSNSFNIGDISVGWSYEMPHSPDLELTQTFGNESLKTQTTKGGHTLSSVGYNQPPMWGNYSQWKRSSNITYPARRSWSLKFSYLNDTDLMPQYYNELDSASHNRGIFERSLGDDPETEDIETTHQLFSIKNDFLSKVMPSINLGLPFIFQPDSTIQEYAIARASSVAMNQVANNVYDISLSVVETW